MKNLQIMTVLDTYSVWEEDLDEEDVPAPSYAGQEWVPQERMIPGGPGSFAGAAGDNGGAADGKGLEKRMGWGSATDVSIFFFLAAAFNEGGYGGGAPRRDGDWDCAS